MIQRYIKQKILEKAISLDKFGMNDLTWEKEAAKILITSLLRDEIGVLGGSVYKIDSSHLIPMYDNWSCNLDEKETRQEFCFRSKIKALDYIDKYPIYPGEKILFSLVFTEDID
jgi:immunity protein 40 of polymorphic toxin system